MTSFNPFYRGPAKYNNKRTEYNGYIYDSKKEAEYAMYLDSEKERGAVLEWKRQPGFVLIPRFRKNGKIWRPTRYIADFWVKYHDGKEEIIDAKGYVTRGFQLKYKLFEWRFPELSLKIV